jgi:hypothetical protein
LQINKLQFSQFCRHSLQNILLQELHLSTVENTNLQFKLSQCKLLYLLSCNCEVFISFIIFSKPVQFSVKKLVAKIYTKNILFENLALSSGKSFLVGLLNLEITS